MNCPKCGATVTVARSPSDGHPELLSPKARDDHAETVHATTIPLVPVPEQAHDRWGARAWWTVDDLGYAHVHTEPPLDGVQRYRSHVTDCKRVTRGY